MSLFGFIGTYIGYQIFAGPGPVLAKCVGVGSVLFMFHLARAGSRLLPFCGARIIASAEGLRVVTRRRECLYPWSEVGRVDDSDYLQILDVYSTDGSRILSVDYYLKNFGFLRECITFYANRKANAQD